MNFTLKLFLKSLFLLFVLLLNFVFLASIVNGKLSNSNPFKQEIPTDNLWFYDVISFDPNKVELPITNTSVIIAIIDSGFNYSLDSLSKNTFKNTKEIPENQIDDDLNGYIDDYLGFDFVTNSSIDPLGLSYTSHSTFISHLLGGLNNTNKKVVGMLPNVSLLNVRILDSNNEIPKNNWTLVTDSLRYAIKMKSNIILLSSEFLADPPNEVKKAFEEVKQADITLVTIAGNSNSKVKSYPALLEWSITVGAIEKALNSESFIHSDYSNVGTAVDIVAPGTDISSYNINGKLISNTGTSFAAPFVAGTAAWIKIIDNSLSSSQIKDIIVNTATPTGDCYSNGAGILNVTYALLATLGEKPLDENSDAIKANCTEKPLLDDINISAFDSELLPFLYLAILPIGKKYKKFD